MQHLYAIFVLAQKLTTRGWLALLVTVLLWASGFVGIRVGLRGYSPEHLALFRYLCASVTMLVYGALARARLPERKDIPVILLSGFASITVYQVCLMRGEQTVTAGAASMLIASAPIFSAVLARVFLHERLRAWGWVGIAISFVGASLIAIGEGGGLRFNLGAFLVLVAAVATGVGMVLQKHYVHGYSAAEFSTHIVCAGTIFLLVFLPGLAPAIRRAPLSATLSAVYLGVFPGGLVYVTWAYVLSRIRVSVAASSLYAVPAFAIAIGWVVLREIPSALSIVGGALAFAGVALVNAKGHEHGALPEVLDAEFAIVQRKGISDKG